MTEPPRKLSIAHGGLNLCDCLGDPRAKDAGTAAGDDNVIFNSDAAESPERLDLLVVDKLRVQFFLFPAIDQSRDEIDARLDRDDKTFMQGAAEPQVFQ